MELLLSIIAILVIIFGIINNVKKKLTVQNYIITNYMYIMVSLLLFVGINNIYTKDIKNILNLKNKLLPLFILSLLLLFGIFTTSGDNQVLNHLLWLGFIIIMSISGSSVYYIAKQEKILNKVLLTLGIIFISMSFFAYYNKLGFFDKYYSYLFFGLLGLIIFQTLDLIFADYENKNIYTRFWYYSIFGIILFSGFLIYDTQKLIKEGKYLEKTCINHLKCANYPLNSLNIFLDIINLFNQLTYVYKE